MRLVPSSVFATVRFLKMVGKSCFTWLVAAHLSIAQAARDRPERRDDAARGRGGGRRRLLRIGPGNPANLTPLTARRGGPLQGRTRVPGDKSISHRALILGALTVGESTVAGLLEGEDVLHTAAAMRALGARLERTGEGVWRIHGVGVGGFAQPAGPLDFGNSGTGVRLAIGAVAGNAVTATFIGDASLSKRPMRRVLDPLERMGARVIEAAEGGRLPLTLQGASDPIPIG